MQNEANPLLSVIVPVYNVEIYLRRCINSILSQTYKNLEIILVDDGSPDNSGKICDEYAEADQRIRVIHQVNKGLSGARNSGLNVATGDYIAFVDSDDWLEPEMYERMLDVAMQQHADIVKCGFNYTDGITDDHVHAHGVEAFDCNVIDNYFKSVLWIVVWNAVYKAELAKKIKFPEGINAEDNYASFFYLYYAKRTVILTDVYYNYFRNVNGIRHDSSKWSNTKYNVMQRLYNDLAINNIELSPEIKTKLDWILAKDYFHMVRDNKDITSIDNSIRKEVISKLDLRRGVQLRAILFVRKLKAGIGL